MRPWPPAVIAATARHALPPTSTRRIRHNNLNVPKPSVSREMLRRELAELTEKLTAAETRWLCRCESGGYVDPPERIALSDDA